MSRRTLVAMMALAAILVAALPTLAAGPNFGEAIYADGQTWGTKGLGDLPPPNGRNNSSFDMLFVFDNAPAAQLPVSEAGPGNPAYNGGRWNVQSTSWTEAGFAAHGSDLPIITSYDELMVHVNLGHITYHEAGDYFLCPLLPVKE
ncbi:MAG TPA: hypothetical protein VK879_22090 [Candidatus Sulfomarinibacteraceae bacterium]|nr:hypothetical protein [Candidatus Sulfomarinibacteraceae bacterium]